MQAFPPPMDQLLDYRAQLLDRLERQPTEFAAGLAAIPAAEWHLRRCADGRSVHQVVAHVRDLEVFAYEPRIRRILDEDQPVLDPLAHPDWPVEQYRPDEPATEILAAWSQVRAELVHRLRPLTSADWTRIGFHPPSGSRTLQWWAERTYSHARDHLRDLAAARLP